MLGDGQVGYQGNSSSKEQHQHGVPGGEGVTIPGVSQSHGDVGMLGWAGGSWRALPAFLVLSVSTQGWI